MTLVVVDWDEYLRPPQYSVSVVGGLLYVLTLKSSLKDFYCSQHEEEEEVDENGQQLGLGQSPRSMSRRPLLAPRLLYLQTWSSMMSC